jgi:hypothetical protein
MWPIAIRTLIADRGKLLTALVGVVFSVVLMNVQGGLFVGLIRKAGLLVDGGEADIWVGHKHMHNVVTLLPIFRGTGSIGYARFLETRQNTCRWMHSFKEPDLRLYRFAVCSLRRV